MSEPKKRSLDERAIQLRESSIRFMDEMAKKYEEVGLLYGSHKILSCQDHSPDFLEGYMAAISDLIIIKKGHWGPTDSSKKSSERYKFEDVFKDDGINITATIPIRINGMTIGPGIAIDEWEWAKTPKGRFVNGRIMNGILLIDFFSDI